MCNIVLIWIIGVFSLCIIGLGIAVLVFNNNHRKRLEELTYYQINTSSVIDESIPAILDLVIKESFTDYQIKSLIALDDKFINSQKEAEIRKDLVNLVTERISEATLSKLSLFYNMQNIGSIIGDKIYITVMNYVIEHNSKLNTEE